MYVSSLCLDYEQTNVQSINMSDIAGLVYLNNKRKKSNLFESNELKQRDHPLNHFLFSFCILPKPCFVYFPKEVIEVITPKLDEILIKNYVGTLDLNEILKESKNFFDKFPTESTDLFDEENVWKKFQNKKIPKFVNLKFEYARNKSFHKLVPKKQNFDSSSLTKFEKIELKNELKVEVKSVEFKDKKTISPAEIQGIVENIAKKTEKKNKKSENLSKIEIEGIVEKIAEKNKNEKNETKTEIKSIKEVKKSSRWKRDDETSSESNDKKFEKFEKKPREEKKPRKFKFHHKNDESSPIAATGSMIYKFHEGEMFLLMIDKSSRFEDLGGKVDSTDESIYFSAAREIEEETNGAIKKESIIKRLENSSTKSLYLFSSKYLLFFTKATEDEEKLKKENIGNVEKNDNIKRTVYWISRKSLLESKLKKKVNFRLYNKKIYEILEKIDQKENQQKK